MEEVKVSIIIPVYNRGLGLSSTLDSVLGQSVREFEVILVNDGSTDDGVTDSVIGEYARRDKRVRALRQANQGYLAARNNGLKNAVGKYVYFADHDDWLHPQLIEYCLWAIEKHDVDFVAFRHRNCSCAPDFERYHDFERIPVVVSTSGSQGTGILKAYVFHTDPWVQFMSMELARSFPFSADRGLTRPFTLLRRSDKWMVSEAVLYFYNSEVSSSMTHKPISEQVMLAERYDWGAFCDLYSDVRASGDLDGLWRQQCSKFLLQGVKIEYNDLRRSKRREAPGVYDRKKETFIETLRYLFLEKKIPMRWAKFRHRIVYSYLMCCPLGSRQK